MGTQFNKYPKIQYDIENTVQIQCFGFSEASRFLGDFLSKDFGQTLWTTFADFKDCFNSCRYYPLKLFPRDNEGDNKSIWIQGKTYPNTTYNFIECEENKWFDLGEITITPKYNDFRDYEPHTNIKIYLPYYGFETLNVDEVMGKTLKIYLVIDFFTGIGTYVIDIKEGGALTELGEYLDRTILTIDTKIGIEIPLFSSNSDGEYLAKISGVLSMIGAVALPVVGSALGVSPGLTALGSAGMMNSGINSLATSGSKVKTSQKNSFDSGNQKYLPQSLFLLITREDIPEYYNSQEFSTLYGKPLNAYKKLGDLQGFTLVDTIHLENINCYKSELDEIENLLKSGVII